MGRRAACVSMALLLTAWGALGHAQERRVICVLVDDLGFGASDQESGAKLLAILRDEVVKESDLVGFAATGSPVTADLQPASSRSLQHAMEQLGAAASREQAVRPDQSWSAIRAALGTASDVVGNLARLDARDKQLFLLTSRSSGDGSFAASFGRRGEAAPPDVTDDVAAVVSLAKAGNVTLRVVSTADPQSPALLRSLR